MLSIKQGQTFSLQCTASQEDGSPQDLSEFSVIARLYKKDSSVAVARFQDSAGLVMIDAAAGTFRIDVDTSQFAIGSYLFDIKYSNGVRTEYSPTEMIEISTGTLQ